MSLPVGKRYCKTTLDNNIEDLSFHLNNDSEPNLELLLVLLFWVETLSGVKGKTVCLLMKYFSK